MSKAEKALQSVREQLAAAAKSTDSKGEAEFLRQCTVTGLSKAAGGMVREYRFDASRRWRFDFAWPAKLVAVEVEGIVYEGKGRHQTAEGYAGDCAKYNAATMLGWRILRGTPKMIKSGFVLHDAEILLGVKS